VAGGQHSTFRGLHLQTMSGSHANLSLESEAAAVRGAHAGSGMLAGAVAADAGSNWAQIYGEAWLQAMCVYYGVAVLLHFVVPAITSPKRVQHGEVQARGDTLRDAARALVPVCTLA